jgi:hypothetical protein
MTIARLVAELRELPQGVWTPVAAGLLLDVAELRPRPRPHQRLLQPRSSRRGERARGGGRMIGEHHFPPRSVIEEYREATTQGWRRLVFAAGAAAEHWMPQLDEDREIRALISRLRTTDHDLYVELDNIATDLAVRAYDIGIRVGFALALTRPGEIASTGELDAWPARALECAGLAADPDPLPSDDAAA